MFNEIAELIDNKFNEGVYDPSILKAIFMAGGSGSGKSYVAKRTTGGHGLKIINSDDHFERLLKNAKMSMDLTTLSDDDMEKAVGMRVRAKEIAKKQKSNYVEGRLGLLIDGTGKDYKKIQQQADDLKELGYDVYMIFVNVSLEVALQRNKARERTVDDKIATKAWKQAQQNIGKFQSLFGNNFKIVDTSKPNDEYLKEVWVHIMKFLKKPVENKIGKAWIDQQLELKKGVSKVTSKAEKLLGKISESIDKKFSRKVYTFMKKLAKRYNKLGKEWKETPDNNVKIGLISFSKEVRVPGEGFYISLYNDDLLDDDARERMLKKSGAKDEKDFARKRNAQDIEDAKIVHKEGLDFKFELEKEFGDLISINVYDESKVSNRNPGIVLYVYISDARKSTITTAK